MVRTRAQPFSDAQAREAEPRVAEATDFDLHGVVRIRLVDAGPSDAAAVGRQLGLQPTTLVCEPDLVIRFVDRLPDAGRMRLLGLNDAAFTDDGFLVLRGVRKSRVRVRIPLEQVGDRCEVVCERGAAGVPLLIALVNMRALAVGAVPLHASSFVHSGTGVVTTGWTKGGKTEALLAFMARGARFVGDEWVYLLADDDRVVGIPEPIRLWDWHLRQLPEYRATTTVRDRRRLRVWRLAELGRRAMSHGGGRLGRAADRARPLVERRLHIDADPRLLFPERALAFEGRLDRLFFVVTHDSPAIEVEQVDPQEVARRMVFSLEYERLDLRQAYLQFRFAFPEAANDLLERSEALLREALELRFAEKEAYVVHHPYPVDLAQLYEAMRPYCE